MGFTLNASKYKEKLEKEGGGFRSADSAILFGTGKSSVIAGLSEMTDSPVLALSPAGGSKHLEKEFDNFMSISISNLDQLMDILGDIYKTFKNIERIKFNLLMGNEEQIKKDREAAKEAGKLEDFNQMGKYAQNGTYPFAGIALEEGSMVSSWIQDEVEKSLGKKLGENKSDMGSDWNVFKRKISEFWLKFFKLPVFTIMATNEMLPSEKQKLERISPDICSGAGRKIITQCAGNAWRITQDKSVFKCQFMPTPKVFTKQKFKPVKYDIDVKTRIDITGRPELVWQYMEDINKKVKNMKSQKK